jgi:hypothetical protein
MENKNNSEKEKALKKYKDLSGISNRQLNIGLWIAKNKKTIKIGIVIFLLFFSASTLSYAAYHYIDYLIKGRFSDQEMLQSMSEVNIDGETVREVMAPKNLLFSLAQSFYSQGKYDFIAKIHNPNSRHQASFYYCFEEKDRELACGHSFILPEEEKYVLDLNKEVVGGVGAMNFVIKEINWQRITAHMISDLSDYRQKRFDFSINIDEFKIDNNFYNLKFTIANNSTFNYKEVPLQIILFNQQREVGVNKYTIRDFLNNSEEQLSIVWPVGVQRANRAIIIPEVNILNEDIFTPYSGN